jgi:hypothetical protein
MTYNDKYNTDLLTYFPQKFSLLLVATKTQCHKILDLKFFRSREHIPNGLDFQWSLKGLIAENLDVPKSCDSTPLIKIECLSESLEHMSSQY